MTDQPTTADLWYADYANVVTLTAWMAEHGHDAREVAYAVEKPWKFEDLFSQAKEEEED